MSLKGRSVLITGGAGFIGTHLYQRLVNLGASVTIFDNLSPQIHGEDAVFNDPRVTFIKGDVTNEEAVRRALIGMDYIFHLAAETGTGQSMYEVKKYTYINDLGTSVLLQALADVGSKHAHVVLASSRSIYGEGAYFSEDGNIFQPLSRSYEQLVNGKWELLDNKGSPLTPIPTPVSLPPRPGSVYAATKYSQEMLVSVVCAAKGFSSSILRFQNVYGEGQSLRNPYTGIISIFYNRLRQGLPVNIFEDGHETRDFVHVSDVVEALVSAISRETKSESLVANVGSGQATSVLKLACLIKKLSGLDGSVEITGDFRMGDIRHCYADLKCAQKALGYEPQVELEDGLQRFINWASSEPLEVDYSKNAMEELKSRGMAK